MDDGQLFCIEYPATVKNDDKMLETLGGYQHINETFSQPNRKLELKFRPETPGCKATCAERTKTSSLLLKAKLMKNTKTGETKVVHEVIGPVETTYKFNGLCDFQYLPMVKNSDTEGFDSIKEKIVLNRLPSTKDLSNDIETTPLFLPPMSFSRTDTVQDYHFRKEVRDVKTSKDLPDNIIGRTRQRRSLYNCFLTFDAEKVPEKPNEAAKEQLENFGVEQKFIEKVKELFEDQKMWLKAELLHKSQVPGKYLKLVLPVVAYYFSSGPWRNQWIKYGYDPRKDQEAAKFQTLDYRLRFRAGARILPVESKRKSIVVSRHKVINTTKAKTSIIDLDDTNLGHKKANEDEVAEQEEKIRDAYLFRPGRLPPSRQVFYQYKSLTVSEAQILIENYKLGSGIPCDEKNGWYKRGLEEKLRNILAETIKSTCFDQDDNVSVATTNVTNSILEEIEEYSDDDFESE